MAVQQALVVLTDSGPSSGPTIASPSVAPHPSFLAYTRASFRVFLLVEFGLRSVCIGYLSHD
ncbi:unnamed protein product [Musa hybrid cultivar]